jgi:hypothetical protein
MVETPLQEPTKRESAEALAITFISDDFDLSDAEIISLFEDSVFPEDLPPTQAGV